MTGSSSKGERGGEGREEVADSSLHVGEEGGVRPKRDLSSLFSTSSFEVRFLKASFSIVSFLFYVKKLARTFS